VYLEVGSKRAFACALDWPGWCRAGRDEARALAALEESRPRYAAVAKTAGVDFPVKSEFEVVERLPGDATTDFGAPGAIAGTDSAPVGADEMDRIAALVEAAWTVFDAAISVAPMELRKGPRGGGRDRDAIIEHVLGAESAYARKLGARLRQPVVGDKKAIAAHRAALLDALRAAEIPERGWQPRYAARRIAWHAIDHAWEVEDRSSPA
jgi:hypothetical protein